MHCILFFITALCVSDIFITLSKKVYCYSPCALFIIPSRRLRRHYYSHFCILKTLWSKATCLLVCNVPWVIYQLSHGLLLVDVWCVKMCSGAQYRLECLNDYISTVTCSLNISEFPGNVSAYRLEFSSYGWESDSQFTSIRCLMTNVVFGWCCDCARVWL